MPAYSYISHMSLALAAIKLGVSGVPCLNMFSSIFMCDAPVHFGHCVHESSVGDVVSGRDMLHIYNEEGQQRKSKAKLWCRLENV